MELLLVISGVFRITFRSRLERGKARPLTAKQCRRENPIWLAREKARKFILLSLLAASSPLLSKTSNALAGDAALEAGRKSSFHAYWNILGASERIAGARSGAAIAGQNPDRKLHANSRRTHQCGRRKRT
jgi:hypothetical protein